MKKILVTGAKFKGVAVLTYGEPGVGAEAQAPLLSIDLREASLDDNQKHYLVACVPVRYGPGYEQNWDVMTGKIKIVIEDCEVDFDADFWEPYGSKINRLRCEKMWKNMSKVERALAVKGVNSYNRHLKTVGWGKNKMNPQTFLRDRAWETDWDNV